MGNGDWLPIQFCCMIVAAELSTFLSYGLLLPFQMGTVIPSLSMSRDMEVLLWENVYIKMPPDFKVPDLFGPLLLFNMVRYSLS